ncbi:hypothetical protein NOVOSPHI9U_30031 [Novosphingobium sp. 9U]|nr:hypothetical protein NOVOSPHI9U_30031 [Novosphingobium sp. 9U]
MAVAKPYYKCMQRGGATEEIKKALPPQEQYTYAIRRMSPGTALADYDTSREHEGR